MNKAVINREAGDSYAKEAPYVFARHSHHAYGETDRLIQDHDLYCQLDGQPERRRACYRELFVTDLDKSRLHAIRNAVNFFLPLGDDRFREDIERTLGRSLGQRKRGRPSEKRHNEDIY